MSEKNVAKSSSSERVRSRDPCNYYILVKWGSRSGSLCCFLLELLVCLFSFFHLRFDCNRCEIITDRWHRTEIRHATGLKKNSGVTKCLNSKKTFGTVKTRLVTSKKFTVLKSCEKLLIARWQLRCKSRDCPKYTLQQVSSKENKKETVFSFPFSTNEN